MEKLEVILIWEVKKDLEDKEDHIQYTMLEIKIRLYFIKINLKMDLQENQDF